MSNNTTPRILAPGDVMPGKSGDVVVKAFPSTVVVRAINGEHVIRTMPEGCSHA